MTKRHNARSFILTFIMGTICVAVSACGSSSTEDTAAGTLDVGQAAAPATATSVVVVTAADSTTNLAAAPTAIPLLPAVENPTATPVPIDRSAPIDYEVQAGDVLGIIAEKYGISLAALLEANGNLNPNTLSIGQSIVIPPTSGATGTDSSGNPAPTATRTAVATPRPKLVVEDRTPGTTDTHTVKDGQFLSIIATAYDVSVDSIVALNGLASADSVFVGQQLQIPPVGTRDAGPVATATVDPAMTPTAVTPTAATPTAATPTVVATTDPALMPTAVATTDPDLTPTAVPTTDPADPTPTVDANATLPTVTATATVVVDSTSAPAPTATVIPCDPVQDPFGFFCPDNE